MGIEAFCPNGHRMKVKDHLAGRLGVCPTCGSRFRLPDLPVEGKTASHIPPGHEPPTPSASGGLPIAQPISLEPAAVSKLPKAVPIGHAAVPGSAGIPLGNVLLQPVPAATVPNASVSVPLGTVPLGTVPAAGLPDVPPAAIAEESWTPGGSPYLPPTPRRIPRRPRSSGGVWLSLTLIVVVAAAATLAWMILQSRGLLR